MPEAPADRKSSLRVIRDPAKSRNSRLQATLERYWDGCHLGVSWPRFPTTLNPKPWLFTATTSKPADHPKDAPTPGKDSLHVTNTRTQNRKTKPNSTSIFRIH